MAADAGLTTEEESELAALAAWLPTAPLAFGPYPLRPGVTVTDPTLSHDYLRDTLRRGVRGQQRTALLVHLRLLWHRFGDPAPLGVDPSDSTRVEWP